MVRDCSFEQVYVKIKSTNFPFPIHKVDKCSDPSHVAEDRTKALAVAQMDDIRKQPSEERKKRWRKKCGMKEGSNSLFSLSVDLFRFVSVVEVSIMYVNLRSCESTIQCRSTPVETLHTLLLGPYKYLLKDVMSHLSR